MLGSATTAGRTGTTCPRGGIWRTGDCSKRIALSQGETFPPCPVHRVAVAWYLDQAA